MRDESQNALLKTLEEPPDVRPPDPAQLRAGGAAGDGRLALPAGRLRAAAGRRRSKRRSPSAGGPTTRSPPPRASPPATSSGPASCSPSAGARAARRGRALRRRGARRRGRRRRPGSALLDRAEAAGEDAEAATREALEEEAEAGVKRSASEIADEAKRAGRRRRTEILDLGLELCAAWLRDLAAVAAGAEEVVFNRDRLDAAARRRPRASTRPRPRAAPSWSRTPAAGLDLNVSEELALEALVLPARAAARLS